MLYDIWLSELNYPISGKRKWLSVHKSAENVYNFFTENRFLFDSELSLEHAKVILDNCEKNRIHVHLLSEFGIPDYGELPFLLYCKGEIRREHSACGIVGARRCTPYGKHITEELAASCALQHITVVSGMAKGVDAIAHTAALKKGGYTIASLGCGPDICYPAEHKGLYEEICARGLVISEYPPGTHATRYTFPRRNRLIAAFSDKLAVTEAGKRSGALITCERARHYGKPVYAFPGPIDSPESEGTNNLIYTGAARMYRKEDFFDMPEQLCLPDTCCPQDESEGNASSILCEKIINYLSEHNRQCDLSALGSYLSLDAGNLITIITELEMEDICRTEGENIWLL